MSGPDRRPGLRPVLGFRDLVLFYVLAVFGVRMVPLAASIGPSVVVLWFLAFLSFFVPLGLAVTDLSSRYPEEGGIYVWARTAFGNFHGFMTAWTYWTASVVFFPSVLMFASTQAAFIVPGHDHLAEDRVFVTALSIAGMLFAFGVNVVGLSVSTWLHNLGAAAKFAAVALIVGLGFAAWARLGSATDFALATWIPNLASVKDLVFLSTLAYMFAGLESASLLGDEIRDARRTIPRAILGSGALIAMLYGITSLALLAALAPGELTGLQGFADATAEGARRVGGEELAIWARSIVSFLLFALSIATVSVWLAAAGRLPFVVGLDRYLPPAFGKLHPRFGSPWVALGSLAAATIVLVVLSGLGGRAEQIYQVLVALELVVFFIPNLYLFAALIKLRRAPAPPGAIRVPGGRIGTLLAGGTGLFVTAGALVLALIPGEGGESPATFYLMVLGSLGGNLLTGVGLYAVAMWKRAAPG